MSVTCEGCLMQRSLIKVHSMWCCRRKTGKGWQEQNVPPGYWRILSCGQNKFPLQLWFNLDQMFCEGESEWSTGSSEELQQTRITEMFVFLTLGLFLLLQHDLLRWSTWSPAEDAGYDPLLLVSWPGSHLLARLLSLQNMTSSSFSIRGLTDRKWFNASDETHATHSSSTHVTKAHELLDYT